MTGNILCDRIYVDNLRIPEGKENTLFLSTFRIKQTESFNNTWKVPIYTSELNIKLLKQFTSVNHDLLKKLVFNEKKLIALNDFNFWVTLLDCHSASGSVMFHFHCPTGEYLYTGQIRISDDILGNKYLLNLGVAQSLNGLYVDTALLTLKVGFKLQSATKRILNIVQKYPGMKIEMAMPRLGMEDLVMGIALKGVTVYPGVRRREIFRMQGLEKLFTVSRNEATVKVIDKKFFKITDSYRRLRQHNIITIYPSCFYTKVEMEILRNIGVFVVMFTDNTTDESILKLIDLVKPQKLYPVNTGCLADCVETFQKYCRQEDESRASQESLIVPEPQGPSLPPDREQLNKSQPKAIVDSDPLQHDKIDSFINNSVLGDENSDHQSCNKEDSFSRTMATNAQKTLESSQPTAPDGVENDEACS